MMHRETGARLLGVAGFFIGVAFAPNAASTDCSLFIERTASLVSSSQDLESLQLPFQDRVKLEINGNTRNGWVMYLSFEGVEGPLVVKTDVQEGERCAAA